MLEPSITMKILVLMFGVPISNKKENRNIATSPWDALNKYFVLRCFD